MDPRQIAKWLLVGLAAAVVVSFVLALNNSEDAADSETNTSETQNFLDVGDEGILSSRNDGICESVTIVAATRDAHDQLVKTARAGDTYGVMEAVLEGQAFPVEECSRVLVIDAAIGLRQVRVLEGEQIARTGWVPYEWVRSDQSTD